MEPYKNTVEDRVVVEVIKPFEPREINGMTVTPLRASHGTPHPYIYLIEEGGKALLYANDTGIFPDETWAYLAEARPRLDLVSMDCTEGAMDDLHYDEHMCLGRNLKIRKKLTDLGLADEGTVFVSNHFSHSGEKVNYCDYSVIAEKHGLLTSYDGMEIVF